MEKKGDGSIDSGGADYHRPFDWSCSVEGMTSSLGILWSLDALAYATRHPNLGCSLINHASASEYDTGVILPFQLHALSCLLSAAIPRCSRKNQDRTAAFERWMRAIIGKRACELRNKNIGMTKRVSDSEAWRFLLDVRARTRRVWSGWRFGL
ncbi:hypothetical protein BDQ17DRAFT_1405278 [Cyathus striatus]|nr:hypothetical protein BDQ17DRAFT_1405278 [Cyathus striatus]